MVRSTRRPSGARALEDVCRAVDHGIEQVHQHGLAGNRWRTGSGELRRDQREGLWFVVANRDEFASAQDEGDGSRLWRGAVRLVHQRRRHVARAVLDIEPAGDFDLLHLLACRHRDAERAFEQLVLGERGRDEIEPDRAFGHGTVLVNHLSFK
jgi:hypothetical protein